MAAIVGLEALNRPCQIQLYSDSKYLVDAFNSIGSMAGSKKDGSVERMSR